MSQSATATLLLELGCEELPAGPLPGMAKALGSAIESLLSQSDMLADGHRCQILFTPRRLAVQITAVAGKQADQAIQKRGPAINVAFDAEGNLTPAAQGFARSVNARVEDLQRLKTDEGEWLLYTVQQAGQGLADVLQQQLADIINKIPMPKTMRWGAGNQRFLRPVHWLLAIHGDTVLPLSVLGLQATNITYGHRIHSREPIVIDHADHYQNLMKKSSVIADFDERKRQIDDQIQALVNADSLFCPAQPALTTEVANLVEWPVPMLCCFDPSFLDVPAEALTLSMKTHQKFFPLYKDSECTQLAHQFIAVANLESTDVQQVQHGFERVIRPRLADAKFFWDQDRKQPLEAFSERLHNVTFQQDLGSLADKARRTQQLAARIAKKLGIDSTPIERAAALSLCDLMSEMVGEFPELQGTMGRYYALESGEDPEVASAIEEHYQPIGSGRPIASSRSGRILAIAEKTDRLLGIFAAGKKPTGNKDPFALRRAALGLIRTLIEGELEITLDWLFKQSADILTAQIEISDETFEAVTQFVYDRLEGYLPVKVQSYRAVIAKNISNLLDFSARAHAVEAFSKLDQASSLAAANKRASNLLRQTPLSDSIMIKEDRLDIEAEKQLFDEISKLSGSVSNAMQERDYVSALSSLANLQAPVDRFFDDVMVMVDDEDLRNNRLALLAKLQSLCSQVADIAELDV